MNCIIFRIDVKPFIKIFLGMGKYINRYCSPETVTIICIHLHTLAHNLHTYTANYNLIPNIMTLPFCMLHIFLF